jgi:predicted CXXCH cytochrome family protein
MHFCLSRAEQSHIYCTQTQALVSCVFCRACPQQGISEKYSSTFRRKIMGRNGFGVSIALVAIVVSAVFFFAGRVDAQGDEVSITYPPSNVFVTQPEIEVVGIVKNKDIMSLQVSVKGGKIAGKSTIAVEKGAFSFKVNLGDGSNQISVNSPDGSIPPSQIIVYLQTERNIKKTPKEFSEYYLHAKMEGEHACDECHNLRGTVPSYTRMKRSSTCMTGDCHQKMGKAEFVHGPAASGTCVACHNPHGSKNEFHRSRTGAEECYVCHENKRDDFAKSVLHSPLEKGNCVGCHDPHQSDTKFQLKAASVSDLCFNCHDANLKQKTFLHGPVAAGGCVVCHDPHASEEPRLLVQEEKVLCFMCHEESKKRFELKFTHKPVTESCITCHHPHGSEDPMLLVEKETELCLTCHEKLHPDVAEMIRTAEVPHPPVAEGKCVSCHTPHSTNFDKQLKAPLKAICYDCHSEVGEEVKAAKYSHGPVESNDCYACHATHGSKNPKILKEYFPDEFYTPYATEKYAICFDCHNEKIALDKVTTTLTNFRNGNLNLHFLHVNKDPKGRSCKACHEVHAGNQAKHIRAEVPFGSMWSYPVEYTQLETGGKCVVGCHKPKQYDRENPVAY